jgi:hypothetical protein
MSFSLLRVGDRASIAKPRWIDQAEYSSDLVMVAPVTDEQLSFMFYCHEVPVTRVLNEIGG